MRSKIESMRRIAAFPLVALAISTAAQAGPAMTFKPISSGGRAGLIASGQITPATPGAFLASVRHLGRAVTVYVSSPGGGVAAAIKLGTLFRRYGVTAVVARAGSPASGASVLAGACLSACVYALMGAAKRIVPARSIVGVHEMAALEDDGTPPGELAAEHVAVRADLMRYASRMGVSPSLIVAAEATPPGELRILSPAEMEEWRLANPERSSAARSRQR